MNFSKNLAVRISIWFDMGKNRKKVLIQLRWPIFRIGLGLFDRNRTNFSGIKDLEKVFGSRPTVHNKMAVEKRK